MKPIMHMIFIVLALVVCACGQVTIEINGVFNTTLTQDTQVPLPHAMALLQFQFTPSPGIARCGAHMTMLVYETEHMGSTVAAAGNTLVVDSVVARVLWCGPGAAAPTVPVQAVTPSAVPEINASMSNYICADNNINECVIRDMVQVAVGSEHACALHSSGTVYCWGSNQYCQLGVGTPGQAYGSMVAYPWFSDFINISTNNGRITCGQRANNDVVCWGNVMGSMSPSVVSCDMDGYSRLYVQVSKYSTEIQAVQYVVIDTGVVVMLTNSPDCYLFINGYIMQMTTGVFIDPLLSEYSSNGEYWTQYNVYTFSVTTGTLIPARSGFAILTYFYLIEYIYTGTQNLTGVQKLYGLVISSIDIQNKDKSKTQSIYGILNYLLVTSAFGYFLDGLFWGMLSNDVGNYCAGVDALNYGNPYPVSSNSLMATATLGVSLFSCSFVVDEVISRVSMGSNHMCFHFEDTDWICFGDNTYGQLPYGSPGSITSGEPGIPSFLDIAAGGNYTCYIFTENGTVGCVGDVDTNMVVPGTIVGQAVEALDCTLAEMTIRGSATNSSYQGILVLDAPSGAGCLSPYTLYCNGVSVYSGVSSAVPMHQTIACGGAMYCFTQRTCVDSAWYIARSTTGDPGNDRPVAVAAGAVHSCYVGQSGQVYCAGSTAQCQYILAGPGDTRQFNAIFMGTAVAKAGYVYAHATTTCIVSVDRSAISCFGMTSSYTWCSAGTYYTHTLGVGQSIIDVAIGASNICVVVALSTPGSTQYGCIGDNPNGMLGLVATPTSQQLTWTSPGQVVALSLFEGKGAQAMLEVLWNNSTSTMLGCSGNGCGDSGVLALLPAAVMTTSSFHGSAAVFYVVGGTGSEIYNTTQAINGMLSHANIAAAIPGTSSVVAIDGGTSSLLCAVTDTQYLSCWRPAYQPGIVPAPFVLGAGEIAAVGVGSDHLLILDSTGGLYCTGSNQQGQCGRYYTKYNTTEIVPVDRSYFYYPVYVSPPVTEMPVVTGGEKPTFTTVELALIITAVIVLVTAALVIGCMCWWRRTTDYYELREIVMLHEKAKTVPPVMPQKAAFSGTYMRNFTTPPIIRPPQFLLK